MKKRLKVANISYSNRKGGAAQMVAALHCMLRELGVESDLFARDISYAIPNSHLLTGGGGRLDSLRCFLGSISVDASTSKKLEDSSELATFERFGGIYSDLFQVQPELFEQYDLIQLNWVNYVLNWNRFFRKNVEIPLVWRLPDMNPFTGGCHFSSDCGEYKRNCEACPQLSTELSGLPEKIFSRKLGLLSSVGDSAMTVVCQSRWMESVVAESRLFSRFPRTVIRNGVDLDQFKPVDKQIAKDILNLPQNLPVVLFASGGSSKQRKGFHGMAKALSRLEKRDFLLATVSCDIKAYRERLNIYPLVKTPKTYLRILYSAADVLLFPSLQDHCPNTVLEAQACGTPVIAFDGSGTTELMEDGETGWLVENGNFDAFAEVVSEIVLQRPESIVEVGKAGRQFVENGFSIKRMANDYIALYERLV